MVSKMTRYIANRIAVGLDKEKFIVFLESLKNYNLDINLQDLNDTIELTRSIKNWEAGQIEFVISKKYKRLRSLSLALPSLSLQELQNRSLFQGSSNLPSKPESSISQYLPFFRMWLQQKYGSPTKIQGIKVGTVNFSRYNSLSVIEPPVNVVNLEELKLTISE